MSTTLALLPWLCLSALARTGSQQAGIFDQQLAAERNESHVIAFTGIVLVLFIAGIWFRIRYIRNMRHMLICTQQQLLKSEKLREAEQIRTRIARDIHIELGSELTKITMLGSEVRDHASMPRSTNKEHLDRIVSLSRHVNSTLNDIVWAVDPLHDNVKDLHVHARIFTERILERAHVRSEKNFKHSGPDRPIDPGTKRSIFLLLKEALNNSLKYAGAKEIRILLETDLNSFKLVVGDDGVGFDPQLMEDKGNGLRTMKVRCVTLNACLQIISSPGKGCLVKVAGPLP
ncbi:MAG: histidine kinase [Bacteroidota bacterium]|nr:histidine kinase [Bacteroidota bacterium]